MYLGIGAYAFIMGIISGYPVGAKIVTEFRKNADCSKAEAERLLAFTNNSGPLFIIGTVGVSMFGNTLIGLLLFITHILSCIIVGFLFRFWKYNDKEFLSSKNSSLPSKSIVTFSNLGEILATSIMNSVNTVVMIGGFVILFSVILSILNNSGLLDIICKTIYPLFNMLNIDIDFVKPTISGFIELTNGLNTLSYIHTKSFSILITFASFILGFGGISVMLQVLSITSKTDISIRAYIIGKLLQGIIAAILTYLIIHIFPIFNLDLVAIFSNNVNELSAFNAYINPYNIFILLLIIITTTFIIFNRKKYKFYKG